MSTAHHDAAGTRGGDPDVPRERRPLDRLEVVTAQLPDGVASVWCPADGMLVVDRRTSLEVLDATIADIRTGVVTLPRQTAILRTA